MSKFKKILIMILLTIPFLIGTGLSAWVIINVQENENPPDYNYETIINNAFNNQDKDYTGDELGPDAMYGGEINTTIIDSNSFTFEYFDGEKWVEGLPTDSGKYNVRVINKYDSNASGIIITFEINKADQRISVENLVVTYDGEEHLFDKNSINIVFGNESDGSITITGNEPRKDVGTTVVTITVAGNSNFNEYSTSVNIEVEPKTITDSDVLVEVTPEYTFDNTEKRPGYSDLVITYNGMTLNTNDYKIIGYANNINATSDVLATVTIEGINNYSGTRVISFEIAKANQNPTFDTSKTYDGNELVIDVTKDTLVTSTPVIKYFDEEKNEISAPTNAGTYFIQVTIEGNNNYNNYDSGLVEFTISPRTINDLTINAVDDVKYTASAITLPKPTVLYGDVTLAENTDYILKYYNANGDEVTEIIDAGTYTIKVIGTGNFEGEKTLTFKVVKNAISAGSFTIGSSVYTGSAIEPIVTIVYDGNTLEEGTDFTVDFDEMIDADTYDITINGIGLYEGTVNKDFVIEPADINDVIVSGIDSLVYTGKNITISPIITYNDIVIESGNYSYKVYQNSIEATIKDAGAYLLKLTGSKNFTNSKEVDVNVAKLDVSNVEFAAGSVTYNATNQTPVVTATYDGVELDASNFSVTSSTTEFINANTYELSISGNTNLTGTTTCDYLINKLEISNVTALYNTSEYYTNSSIKPEINLTYKEITLEQNTDFTVSYGENIEVGVEAGSITVTATESSNFKGSHTYYFDIVMQSVASATITGYNSTISYTGTKYMPDVTVMIGDVTLRKDVDYKVEYGENVDAGTQTYILVKGIGIYEGEQNIVVNIVKANITGISFQDKTVTYSGNNNKIEITGTLPTDVSVEYYYTSDLTTKFTGEVEVGSYDVTAVFTVNNPNYNDLDNMAATLHVEKASFNMDGISFDDLVTVYNGLAHTIKLTGTLPADLGVEYYIGEEQFTSATLAGTYTVTAKFVDKSTGGNNYQLPLDMTATLVIEKAQPIITIYNNIYKVDYLAELGLTNNYIVTVNPDNLAPVVTIVDALGNDVTNESTLVVGTYTVTISIEGNNNTKAATNSFTLEVEKIDPVYPALPVELYGIYGNTLSTVSGLPTGWVFTNPDTVMSTTGEMVADVKFVPSDTDNYNVINTTIKVVVEKATIFGITFESHLFEYDGTNKMITITGTLPTGVTVKYYVDDVEFTGAVNAGEYTIKAVFTDTTGNYNDIAPMTATLTITKIDAVIDGVTFVNKEVNYSGKNNTITITGTLPDYLDVVYYYYGTTDEFSGVVNAGTYKVTAKFVDISGGENYNLPSDLHATLTINQIMDPSYVEQTAFTASFGNTLNDIKAQLLTGWSFVDDLSTSVGNGGTRTVKVTYTPTDTTNYLTVTKDIEITVNAIDPSFTVTDNTHVFDNTAKDVTVTTNSDGIVTIIYKLNNEVVTNPTNVGTYDIYVSISGTTNYNAVSEKLADVKLVISAYNITSENTTLSGIVNKEYTGSEVTQDVVVTSTVFGKLTEGVDYDVTYVNNIDLGTATVKVTMKGNYSGTLTQDFEITTGSINDAAITPIEDVVYSGKEAVYSLVVTVNGKVLTLNTDYTVEILGDTVNVGTVKITVTGKGNYSGTGTTTFNILKANIEDAIDFEIADQTYLEGGNTPLPEIYITGIGTLIKDTDYKVTYTNNEKVGIATMTVQGIKNFEGEIVKTFNIVQKSIDDATVSYENEFVYSGNEYKPSVTLSLDGYATITYDVTYKNNKDAGTATITVTATGNFTGSKELEFTINKFDLEDLLDSQISITGDFTYKASQITPSVSVSFNGSTLDAANYTVTYGTNLTVKDGGTVTITANNNTNFTGSKVVKFNITPMSIKDADVTFATEYYKNGVITPTPTVKVNGFDTLVQGVDYTISHAEIFNAGEYTITIIGSGNFTGTISKTLDVLPISIEDAVIGDILNQNYTGSEITPKPTIVVQDKYTLVEDQDYTLTYEDNVNVGIATITIVAKGNFTGTITKQFNIVDTIASSTVYFGDSTSVGPFTYNNTAHKPTVTKVVINGVTLVEGVHYNVEYAENINAGTGHVYIVAIENGGYIASKDIEFTIEKADQTISVENINITYDGNSHMVSATSSIGSAITYTVDGNAFIGATNAGEYVITITAAGNSNYNAATTTATITIAKFDIKDFVIGENIIDFVDSYVYTGNAISPSVNLVFNGNEIEDNFTFAYTNNIEPTNSAIVTISANSAANFTGSKTLTYEITKVPQTITASDITVEYNKDYTVTYSKLGDGIVTITYKDLDGNIIEKPTEVGTYKAVISVAEGTHHFSGSTEITITITPISSTIQVTENSFVYNGQPVAIGYTTNSTGVVTIVYKYNGEVVTNPTIVGKYDVTITQAAAGNYTASEITTEMTITKAKPSITITNNTLSFNYGQTIDVSTNITVNNNFDNIDYVVTYNGVTTVPTLPGTYPVVVTLPGNMNQEATSATFTLVINKVNATYEGTKTFNATYGDKLIDVIKSSGLVCADDLLVGNAGKQTITVTYNPDSNVYNTINVEITVNVAKAKVTIPDNTLVEVEYSGTLYEFKPTGFDSSLMNITNNTETVVGNYSAVVSLKDADNYEWSDSTTDNKEYSFSIYAKKVTIPTFVDKVYTYNTNAQTVEINNLDLTVMTITGNTQTNAGTHKVTIALIDKANYVWSDGSTDDLINDFVIEKAKIAKPSEGLNEFTYTGLTQIYLPTGFDSNIMSISGNEQVNANTYNVVVKLTNNNYVWLDGTTTDIDYTFTINKKDITGATILFDSTIPLVYTGSEIKPITGIKIDEFIAVTIDEIVYENNTNAGTASYTINGNGNFEGSITGTFVIEKAKVTRPQADTTVFVYSGIEQTYNIATSDLYTITGTTIAINASNYSIKVSLNDTSNYMWDDSTINDLSYTFTINKKDITEAIVLFDSTIPLVYTGSEIKPITGIKLDGFIAVTIDEIVYENNTNAGTASYTINGNGNFEGTIKGTFVINRKDIAGATVLFDNSISLVYDGNAKELIAGITYAGYTDITYVVKYYNNTNAGTASYIISGTGNYIGTIDGEFNIQKADLTYDETVDITATYGDTLKDIISKLPNNFSWVDETQSVGNASTSAKQFDAIYNPDSINYNDLIVQINVLVNKKTITGITFNDAVFNKEEGIVHSLVIDGVLPTGVDVKYYVDGEEFEGASEIGIYVVTAVFTDTTGNYIVPEDMIATLEITDKVKVTLEVLDTTVEYDGTGKEIIINIYDRSSNIITDADIIAEIMSLITITYETNELPTNVKYDGDGQVTNYLVELTVNSNNKYDIECSTLTAYITITPRDISEATVEIDDTDAVYNGSQQTPEFTVLIDGNALEAGTDYIFTYGANINAGNGSIAIRGQANYTGSLTPTFTIQKATPVLEDSDWVTIKPFVEGLTPTLSQTNATINDVQGMFLFDTSVDISNIEYQGNDASCNGKLVVKFVPTDKDNYNPVSKELDYTMYAVAYIGTSTKTYYGTIAEAISAAASASTKKAYVVPGLSNSYGIGIPVTETITIPSGVSLYIPYSGTSYNNASNFGNDTYKSKKNYADANADTVAANRATLINLRNGADIIIQSGANLYHGGEIFTFGIVGLYSEINLGSGSMIDCSGNFYCYGYVKENSADYLNGKQSEYSNIYDNSYDDGRCIIIQKTGILETFIAMYDMKDASHLLTLKDGNVFALNLFDFPNLQTYTEVIAGGQFNTYTYLVAENSTSPQSVHEFLKAVASSGALFNLESGSIAIEYCPSNPEYTDKNALTRIFVNGKLEQGTATISMSVPIIGDITVSSQGRFLPLSYKFNVFVNNGGIYSSSHDIKFLPGSLLQINEGGVFNVNGALIIYKGENQSSIISYTDKTDARLINNGTINVGSSGSIAGLIETTMTNNSAILNFESCTGPGNFSVTSIEGYNLIEITQVAEGYFIDSSDEGSSLYQFKAGTRVSSDPNGSMKWVGEFNTTTQITVNIAQTTYTNNLYEYELLISDFADGTGASLIQSSTQNAGTYDIPIGKYIRINASRHAGATFDDGTIHNSSTWYYIDGTMSLTIEPSEGLKLIITTDGESGNGSTVFSVHESSSKTGTFTQIAYLAVGDVKYTVIVAKNAWFKVVVENGGTGSSKLDPDNYTITPEIAKPFKVNTAYQMNESYTVYLPRTSGISAGNCLAEGTLITMADGTKKKVEEIVAGDVLIVFNHETGKYETAEVLFNDSELVNNYVVINLEFSNDSVVRVIAEHGFFDLDLMQYVYIDEYNYMDYVGHRFVASTYVDGEVVQSVVTLDNAFLTEEYIRVYSPVTKYHMNYITEDILSMPGGIEGLFNIFEYDDNLQYNEEQMQKDIETYGLFTYEDFKDLVSYEVYCSFPAAYFKVALGKGILTWEDLEYYIARYAPLV